MSDLEAVPSYAAFNMKDMDIDLGADKDSVVIFAYSDAAGLEATMTWLQARNLRNMLDDFVKDHFNDQ